MATKETIDYDIEEVIAFCEVGAQTDIHNLMDDLKKLCNELEDCQDKFHCKGGDNANAVIQIYKGFAQIIGKNSGLTNESGVAGLGVAAAKIINICYASAKADEQVQRAANYTGMSW